MVALKYVSNFWRAPEMSLVNCKFSLQLKWSRNFVIVTDTVNNHNRTSQINYIKLYVLVVNLSAQENINLLKKLESGYKITINWSQYLAKRTNQAQKRYLDYLIHPSFPGVNRLFVLAFKDDNGRESLEQYYLPTVEVKDYNAMIDARNFFDQPIKTI